MIKNQIKKYSAIILAAGQGSRLGYKHKALVKIKQKTLLEYWIEKLVSQEVNQIIITDLKGRIQNTKKTIQQKFKSYLNHIQYVEFDHAPGPGLTLMKSLQYVKNSHFFLISCDTFSNISLAELYFDENVFSGKMLVSKNKQGYLNIIQKQSQYVCQEQNEGQQDKYVYAGLCSFITKDLLSCCNQSSTEMKQILFRMIKKFKILALKLQETKYYFENINTKEDFQKVVKIASQVNL